MGYGGTILIPRSPHGESKYSYGMKNTYICIYKFNSLLFPL